MAESNYELALDRVSKTQFSKTSMSSRNSSMRSSCRICLSSIHDPAALTCGHKFCECCLEKYWDVKDRPDYIVCPLCRACAFNVDFTKVMLLSSGCRFQNLIKVARSRRMPQDRSFCKVMGIPMFSSGRPEAEMMMMNVTSGDGLAICSSDISSSI